jgi:hypothetical protein
MLTVSVQVQARVQYSSGNGGLNGTGWTVPPT